MMKCRETTDISLVTDTISINRKKRYLNCRYDKIPILLISAIYHRYFRYVDPPLWQTLNQI